MKICPFLKRAALALLMLALPVHTLAAADETPVAAQGESYKKNLAKWIREADHITFTEISDPKDFPDSLKLPPDERPRYEYAKVRLTDAQKSDLLKAVEAMDGTTTDGITRCYFPHHRMDLVDGNGTVSSSMEICLECDRVKWGKDLGLAAPKGLMGTLGATVEAAGLAKEKNWKKMAKERLEKDKAKKD